MTRKRICHVWVFVILGIVGGPGQTADNAGHEGFLERYAATYRFRLGKPSGIVPAPEGDAVLFLRSAPRSFVRDLYELDLESGEERTVVTAAELLGDSEERLTAEERARRERMRLAAKGIVSFEPTRDGRHLLIPLGGRLFWVERETGEARELPGTAGPAIDARLSPDGRLVACVREGDLHVLQIADGAERRLTRRTADGLTHGLAEFVAQEEMGRHRGFWWSPDSAFLVYQRTDTTAVEKLTIADSMHPEKPPKSWPYPRPGRTNASVELGIVPVSGGPTTWIDWDRKHLEYLVNVTWPENGPLTLTLQDRRQKELHVLRVDLTDGSTSTLLVEKNEDWIEIDQSVPHWLPDGSGFLWTTERSGALQVELRDPDGRLRRGVTPPEIGTREFLHYFEEHRELLVAGGPDPTQTHLYRVPLSASDGEWERVSNEPGIHSAAAGRLGSTWVHHVVPLDGPERWEVVGAGGPTGRRLRSRAESPGFRPNLEFTTVGDDPAFHAVLVRPRDFDPSRKYPVIDHVYGGPTSVMVRRSPQRYLLDQWIADHGFVVVSIDGRGTPNRGAAWQREVHGDLIRVPLEDQAAVLRRLGQKYGELDLDRVGIYGWSFGGYFSAMALMRRPDLFKVGIAGAPVVDWSDYDTHYTERYMDLPRDNPEGYAAANVLTYAHDLTRPLLLIHGTADDNVYFVHSLKLADALFRAGKPFEFLPLPGYTHMVPDPLVSRRLYTKILDFLEAGLRPTQP